MADNSIAAKREARRKRILENSENRMSKITGLKDLNTENEGKNLNTSEPKTEKDCKIIKEENATYERKITESGKKIGKVNEFLDQNQRNWSSFFDENDQLADFNWEPSPKTSEISKSDDRLFTYLLTRITSSFYLIIFCLAFAANLCIIFKPTFFEGQTIVIPFGLLVASKHIVFDLKEPQVSAVNWLCVALLLLKIDYQLISQVKTRMNQLHGIATDFAFYLSSFVLVRFLILQCL